MPLFAFEGREPDVSPEAWIAPTATLVGDVRVEAEASVWYGAVLRADFGPILVRRGANIQDGSMLAAGIPARVVREVTGQASHWVQTNPSAYRELARRHAASARPVTSTPPIAG
jgi:carbonic anhydrase/acetyltransferase-like protein (isoleucine patch superfamily)